MYIGKRQVGGVTSPSVKNSDIENLLIVKKRAKKVKNALVTNSLSVTRPKHESKATRESTNLMSPAVELSNFKSKKK